MGQVRVYEQSTYKSPISQINLLNIFTTSSIFKQHLPEVTKTFPSIPQKLQVLQAI